MKAETSDFVDLLIDRSLKIVEFRCISFGEFLQQFEYIDDMGWALKNSTKEYFCIEDLYKIHTGEEKINIKI